ncbi:MAG: hypothetical protein ACUVUG_09620 [Candidatus Aminicenantia bacterium]
MIDEILKKTIYWHLKYTCRPSLFMSPEEKERECKKALELITKNSELWEHLKSSIVNDSSMDFLPEYLSLNLNRKELKLSSIEKAIIMGLKDASYIVKLPEQEKASFSLLTK